MLSTSRDHLQWNVLLAGRQYIVDVAWPGFSNQIAVDGQVLQRWTWPGNNLHTTRSFVMDGIQCTIHRRRSGLASFVFDLHVGATGAVVEQLEPPGAPLVAPPPPNRIPLVLALVTIALVLLVALGVGVAVMASAR